MRMTEEMRVQYNELHSNLADAVLRVQAIKDQMKAFFHKLTESFGDEVDQAFAIISTKDNEVVTCFYLERRPATKEEEAYQQIWLNHDFNNDIELIFVD